MKSERTSPEQNARRGARPSPGFRAAGVLALAAAAINLTATGCSTTGSTQVSNPYPPGTTIFLGDLPPRPAPQRSTTAYYTPPDTVSYWDGAQGGKPKIRIDLSEQKAYFYQGGQLAGVSAISSGDDGHRTPTGTFRVTEKRAAHRSNLYGDFVDSGGNVVVSDVSSRRDSRPSGTSFRGASMPYFMRFNGAIGMHAGYLPGYPASHGCVRLPDWMAENFYHNAPVGTTVVVQH